jgi:hypothetical protein
MNRLLIVCGIPGAGKSTLAHRAVERWNAVSFASETFAEALEAAARTDSGDLSKEAIVHAYDPAAFPKHRSRKARIATGPLRVDFSPTSDRLDNRNYADGTKQSNEQQVTVRRRKTATERSERREHD